MTEASKRKKVWLLPTLALIVIAGLWLVFRLMFPPFVPPLLPVPNGYDDLLRAAKLVAPRTGFYRDKNEMGAEELKAIVEHNEPALELAREALQQECVVALNWSADRAWLNNVHSEQMQSLRQLGRAFAAAARQANEAGHMDEAVRCGLDTLDLAQAISPGGLIVDRQIAGGVHYTAIYALREQVDQLSRDDCLRLQKNLRASPLKLESPAEVMQREVALFRQFDGLLQSMMMRGAFRSQSQQAVAMMQESDKRHALINLLLQTHLALRAYQLDNNRFPEKLDELVPVYLPAVPQDPFASGPLLYRPQANSYLLYSVGPDGVDDNGVEQQSGSQTSDILLEIYD